MTKGPHSHPSFRNLTADQRRIEQLEQALQACVTEMETFFDDADCDHSVGICWCSFHRAIFMANAAGAKVKWPARGTLARQHKEAQDRSDRFMAELE